MDKKALKFTILALILSIAFISAGSGSRCDLHNPIYINVSIEKVPLVN